MNKKIIASVITLLAAPMVALAQQNFVVIVINNLLTKVVWPVFVGLVIIMFIWAGILYLTARGDPEKFKKANLAVIFAIVGIIVAILGYRIVATVRSFIPVSCTWSTDCPDASQLCRCSAGNPPCAGASGLCR